MAGWVSLMVRRRWMLKTDELLRELDAMRVRRSPVLNFNRRNDRVEAWGEILREADMRTYSPHRGPVPHCAVWWMSCISASLSRGRWVRVRCCVKHALRACLLGTARRVAVSTDEGTAIAIHRVSQRFPSIAMLFPTALHIYSYFAQSVDHLPSCSMRFVRRQVSCGYVTCCWCVYGHSM